MEYKRLEIPEESKPVHIMPDGTVQAGWFDKDVFLGSAPGRDLPEEN